MPTIKEVINRVKLQGDIPDSIKNRWLGELDGIKYKYPYDADTELVIKKPTNIYEKYLRAMNDFFTGNLREYEKSADEFKRAYAERGVTCDR